MKIFCLYSSPRGEESKGFHYIQKLVNELESQSGQTNEVYLYHAKNLPILPSDGEEELFISGVDKLDEIDNFNQIKDQLMSSELIIIGSPVFAQNVSVHMKIFIERISQFAHDFSLMGKIAYIVTSSYSNGNNSVHDYIKNTLKYMGVVEVGRADIVGRFYKEEMVQPKIKADVQQILQHFENEKSIFIDESYEEIFNSMRSLYVMYGTEPRYKREFDSYQKKGLLDDQTFKQHFLKSFHEGRGVY